MVRSEDVIPMFLEACPGFQPRWKEHLAYWEGEPAGVYNDLAEFVDWVVDAYESGELLSLESAFATLERLLIGGDANAQEVAVLGFIETLQNVASWKSFGPAVFLPFLGPHSMKAWHEVNRFWEGKTSLADVIRSERDGE